MSTTKPKIFAALIAGALALGGLATGASAATGSSTVLSQTNIAGGFEKSSVQQIDWRRAERRADRRAWKRQVRRDRAWYYNPRSHGPRYRVRRPGFGYFYGGYYYPRPWWRMGPGPVVVLP